MVATPGLRALSLAATGFGEGISCHPGGVFVGDVPLLARNKIGERLLWSVRPLAELNTAISTRYRLPVDVIAKAGALALVAKALNDGDFTLAAVAVAQMRFPDPPSLGKGAETDEEWKRRAIELHRSGLLKGDWDRAKHPRTGMPPNPGRFAPKPKPASVPSVKPRAGWPLRHVNAAARVAFEDAADIFAKTGRFLFWGLPVLDGIAAFMQVYSPTELNSGEDRLTAQLKAALQAPKTLEELQQDPTENVLGYEQHHIVNQKRR